MNDNVIKAAITLKSLMNQIKKDLDSHMKVEDKVPEDKTNSMKELLNFTGEETKNRPTTSKPGKVEKGKKVKSKKIKTVKKSVDELMVLLAEVGTYKAWSAKSPSAIQEASGDPSTGELRGDELQDLADDENAETNIRFPGYEKQEIGGDPD